MVNLETVPRGPPPLHKKNLAVLLRPLTHNLYLVSPTPEKPEQRLDHEKQHLSMKENDQYRNRSAYFSPFRQYPSANVLKIWAFNSSSLFTLNL